MEPLIELKGVVKEFRSVPPVRPLDGVSLAVAPGRIVAVTGVSGKGKSTLLNVMGGLLRADEGSVLYHGTDLARASAAEIDAGAPPWHRLRLPKPVPVPGADGAREYGDGAAGRRAVG